MSPPTDAAPLHAAVLAGRFFGAPHAGTAERLAAWLAGSDTASLLADWLGPLRLARLAALAPAARVGALRATLDRDIAALDAAVSTQFDAISRHPRMRRLEGSWRGLAWLVARLPASRSARRGRVELQLLQLGWEELARDLERAIEFDQSETFRKVYEQAVGTAGGHPFSLVIGDYEVRHEPGPGHRTDDVNVLRALAGVAAAAFAPILLGAAPQLLGLDRWSDLRPRHDLGEAMRTPAHARWRAMRDLEDLRFIGVALPRVLGRAPWADDGTRADTFRWRAPPPPVDERTWTSAVYGFAAVAMRAFLRHGWPAQVRGADFDAEPTGGVVDGLPAPRWPSDPAGDPLLAPLEVALTDVQEHQAAEAGLIVLAALEGLPEGCFGALPTLHRPRPGGQDPANVNRRLSSQFNSVLCVSRFAHCIKVMGRDMLGSALAPEDVEERLNRWLQGFIGGHLVDPANASDHPLVDGRVEVRERRAQPGTYTCVVHLQPQYQLDDIGATFRIVTQLGATAEAA